MMTRVLFVLAALCSLAGCATLEQTTSGQIGCPQDEIVILEDKQGWATRSWTAECRGKRYYCSAVGGESVDVSCNEDTASAGGGEAAAAPSVGVGCSYDTQCKGDRICVQGQCVSPPPPPAPPPAPAEETPSE
jgi:hypothetical protein